MFDAAIQIAESLLTEHSEFYPLALILTHDGRVGIVKQGAVGLSSDMPSNAEVVRDRLTMLVERRAEMRCASLVEMVADEKGTCTAVRARLEHRLATRWRLSLSTRSLAVVLSSVT